MPRQRDGGGAMSAVLEDEGFFCDGRPAGKRSNDQGRMVPMSRAGARQPAVTPERALSRLLLDFLKEFSAVRQKTVSLSKSGRLKLGTSVKVDLLAGSGDETGEDGAVPVPPEPLRVPPFVARLAEAAGPGGPGPLGEPAQLGGEARPAEAARHQGAAQLADV